MPATTQTPLTKTENGFTVTAHIGDRAVLLAFDIDEAKTKDLAGFAVHVIPKTGKDYWLPNRLSFQTGGPKYVSSYDAPIQMFHWVHFPPEGAGTYTYDVTARYFDGAAPKLKDGPKVSLDVTIADEEIGSLAVGLTRGYVSSQAFIDKFLQAGQKQADLWPKNQTIDFDTKPFEKVYAYLGAHGRTLVQAFLAEAKTKKADLDIFAYDFNEPDVVRAIAAMAKAKRKVRIYLDDFTSSKKDPKTGQTKTSGHGTPTSLETKAAAALKKVGVEIQRGHFKRFAHDKVFIMKIGGKATKVLTGSANFSLRGLYVQANSVLVFDDATIAAKYEEIFEAVFTNASKFASGPLAAQWFDFTLDNSKIRISYAPHKTAFPLDDTAQAITGAGSSVLFAVMEPAGGGPVLDALKNVGQRSSVLSLGTIEKAGSLSTFKGNDANSQVVSFAYLKESAPPPFQHEVDAGQGQHIHHKFVVCDFNGKDPVVFCGSSNLAQGGETSNGDNLLAIYDRRIAATYAVEAVRLFDHYRFRGRQSKSTDDKPLLLATDDSWTKPFYDAKDIRFREREVFAAAVAATDSVFVGAPGPKLHATPPKPAMPGATKPVARRKPAKPRSSR